MELTTYHKMRTAVQGNASPGARSARAEAVEELRRSLLDSFLFDEVEVEDTDDPDHLVIAMCKYPEHTSHAQVAARLERLWQDRWRYGFWEAHTLLVDADQVELQGATRTGAGGHYLTVHVVAQKARVPAQRKPLP